MDPKPSRSPGNTPDSLPKTDNSTDVLPDDVRRTDSPQTVPPDSLPPAAEEQSLDGGVAEHPIHDDDLEDRGPEDFEREIDNMKNVGPR